MAKKTEIKVLGMSCQHCVSSVEKALKDLKGVRDLNVSLDQEKADINYDESEVDLKAMKKAIKDAGYTAELQK
jgi:copper chaperone